MFFSFITTRLFNTVQYRRKVSSTVQYISSTVLDPTLHWAQMVKMCFFAVFMRLETHNRIFCVSQ